LSNVYITRGVLLMGYKGYLYCILCLLKNGFVRVWNIIL